MIRLKDQGSDRFHRLGGLPEGALDVVRCFDSQPFFGLGDLNG